MPVTIRLLDPPLHEFLPDPVALAIELERTPAGPEHDRLERVNSRVRELHESNPMLGTRGCRLALVHPEIYVMQVRAIVRGALAAGKDAEQAQVEIMIPLVAYGEELRRMRTLVEETVAEELAAAGETLEYLIGTMIELPRAALRAAELAESADFFSFGTNDLTQTAIGPLARRCREPLPRRRTSRTACSRRTPSRRSTRRASASSSRSASSAAARSSPP